MKSILVILTITILFSGLTAREDPLRWAKGAVWYQIFPERFHNGFSGNDPVKANVVGKEVTAWQIHPWTSAWYKLQSYEKCRSSEYFEVVFERMYGGDLIGVIQKLDYLQELGIEVIYFNPIFEAQSSHKYDASSYHHIDNNFGYNRSRDWEAIKSETNDPATWTWTSADSVFLNLIKEAHDHDIKVVIDGVFNHCGTDFWAFKDLLEKQQQSPYKDWFIVKRFDDPATPDTNEFDYSGWWGHKSLPEFSEDENSFVPPVKEYFYNITRRWMDPNGDGDTSDGVDGWRLDVALDINPHFWEEWNALVKSINPMAITVGEIWKDASEWIEKKRFDALMNYPFAYPFQYFFVNNKNKMSVTDFDKELARVRSLYPEETNYLMMNLIGSHDTDRFASMIKNPDLKFDNMRSLRDNPDYDPTAPSKRDRKIQKLMILFQMTYIGAPMVYYGDEAGMWGDDDPGDRKPMIWPEFTYEDEVYTCVNPDITKTDKVVFNRDLFNYYKKMIRLRKETPALKYGDFKTVLKNDDLRIYAFSRSFENNTILVVLNPGDFKKSIELPLEKENKRFINILNNKKLIAKDGKLRIALEAFEGVVLSLR